MKRYLLGVIAGSVIGLWGATAGLCAEQSAEPPSEGSTAPHPETERLKRRVGTWEVVMTLRTGRSAKPIVIAGLPAPGSNVPDFRRIDYLTYNTLQRRWQYLSLDTRAAVGLMYAQSMGNDQEGDLTVYFTDFPAPTEFGPELAGHFARVRHVLTRESDSREVVRQYWTVGTLPEWVGVQYEYTRRARRP